MTSSASECGCYCVCSASVNNKYLHWWRTLHINPRNSLHSSSSFYLFFFLFLRCLIKDFELRPNVLDLLQHVFIKKSVGREKILQKQLIELIDLNQQIGVIDKTRYCHNSVYFLSKISHFHHKMFDRFCYKTPRKTSASLPVSGFYMVGCSLAFADSIIQITLLGWMFYKPCHSHINNGSIPLQLLSRCSLHSVCHTSQKYVGPESVCRPYGHEMLILFLSFKPSWKDRQKHRQ